MAFPSHPQVQTCEKPASPSHICLESCLFVFSSWVLIPLREFSTPLMAGHAEAPEPLSLWGCSHQESLQQGNQTPGIGASTFSRAEFAKT